MSTKELQNIFPSKKASARRVKAWLRKALLFRDVDESQMRWVDNCVWIGYDLYHLQRSDVAQGLKDFGAPSETAHVISRDIIRGTKAKNNWVAWLVMKLFLLFMCLLFLFLFVERTTYNFFLAGLVTAFVTGSSIWFWPGKLSMWQTLKAIHEHASVNEPYSPTTTRGGARRQSSSKGRLELSTGIGSGNTTSYYPE